MPFGYASLLTIGLIYMDVVLKPCRGLDADGFACRNDAALPALFRAAVVGGQHHAVFVGHEAESPLPGVGADALTFQAMKPLGK